MSKNKKTSARYLQPADLEKIAAVITERGGYLCPWNEAISDLPYGRNLLEQFLPEWQKAYDAAGETIKERIEDLAKKGNVEACALVRRWRAGRRSHAGKKARD